MPRTKTTAKKPVRPAPEQPIPGAAPTDAPVRLPRSRPQRGETSAAPPRRSPTPPPPPSPPRVPQVNTLPPPYFADARFERNYNILRTKEHEGTRVLDLELLGKLHLGDATDQLLENVGWTHFAKMRMMSYPAVTVEFLASFEFEEKPLERGFGYFHFDFLNRHYQIPLARINEIFGWPVDAPIPLDSTINLGEVWHSLTERARFEPSISKATAFRHPCLRILHKFLAKSLMGRGESDGAVSADELRILWSMVNGTKFDTAYILGKKMRRLVHSSTQIMGGFIAAIVMAVTDFDPVAMHLREVKWLVIDQPVLVNMKMIVIERGIPVLKPRYRDYMAQLRGDPVDPDPAVDAADAPVLETPPPSPPPAFPFRASPPQAVPVDTSHAPTLSDIHRDNQLIHARLDHIERRQDEFSRLLEAMHAQQTAYFRHQGFHYDPPPPPDAP